MNELDLIERLKQGLPTNEGTRVGVGDDCAVLDLGVPGRWLLFKTDAVVEGVHFQRGEDPRRVGHKALARCLSDVAAMAGTPTHALVTLGLPASFDPGRVDGLYGGLNALARRHGVGIVGGETTANPEGLFLSIALLGWVEAGRCPLRSGARVGDAVFVTGELGGSLVSGKHLDFEPRLEEARWLAGRCEIHSLIDLSDGLATDLPHILRASGVGAELLAEAIPISRAARAAGAAAEAGWGEVAGAVARRAPLVAALADGEDFELLFTVAAGEAVPLLDAWEEWFPGLRLSCIGRITPGSGVAIRDRSGVRPMELHGYVHFEKS